MGLWITQSAIMFIMLNGFGGAVDNFSQSDQEVRRGVVDNFGWDAYKSYYVKLVGEVQNLRAPSTSIPGKSLRILICAVLFVVCALLLFL